MPDPYLQIPGRSEFEPLYQLLLREIPDSAWLVEVGTAEGRSTASLAVGLRQAGKSATLLAVVDSSKAGEIVQNLQTAGVAELVTVTPQSTTGAVTGIDDESLDGVILPSAPVRYATLCSEFLAWWPKLKPGGLLAGVGDAGKQPGLARALQEFFEPGLVQFVAGGFRVRKPLAEEIIRRQKENSRCVILVPVAHRLEPECDASLRELESQGYVVRRMWGMANIDLCRSQMATDALEDGFEELFWIDADIGFSPAAVGRLRSHGLPLACGIYPKKGQRALAANLGHDTKQVVFGPQGGLLEIQYAATGFLYTQAAVYADIQKHCRLPHCNRRFGTPVVPYFLPLVVAEKSGEFWYMTEDFSFCERARQTGIKILADTTIRLQHIGSYRYGWEDAGSELARYGTYVFQPRQ